jgi:integrase
MPKNAGFQKDLLRADIDRFDHEGRRLVFHSLRHTYATNLSKSGVSPRLAMELMRHSDI